MTEKVKKTIFRALAFIGLIALAAFLGWVCQLTGFYPALPPPAP